MTARLTDPETSQLAAADTAGREAVRNRLLRGYARGLVELGDGLTDHEAMVMAGYDPRDGHWRRCSDLRRAGLIAQVVVDGQPVTRASELTGRQQMVCTLTEAGIEAVCMLE